MNRALITQYFVMERNPAHAGMQFSVLLDPDAESSFISKSRRIQAHSERARVRAFKVRLFSLAVIAKGRVIRARPRKNQIG
jgi:hypothetical protein